MLRTGADVLADRALLPTSVRAVLGYYAASGVFDYSSLRLKNTVDTAIDGMIADAFEAIEEDVAGEFGRRDVEFAYDTKLVLPARLTLGYLYRRLEDTRHQRAESLTRLVVEALMDGDMRDAINDNEFDDFVVDFETTEDDLRTIATLAQDRLQDRVDDQFARFPGAVRERYEWAVDRSERHQDRDPYFRRLLSQAMDGDDDARDRIVDEYKSAEFDTPPEWLTDTELTLPYMRTQYDRVGVIYDGMVGMYRGADLPIGDQFRRSVVLAIIGAQIWLDDVTDYHADRQSGQLTPVTAEYLVADSDRQARETVVDVTDQYLSRAREQAIEADSTLTGIAVEYIWRQGDVDHLPGGGS